MLKDIGREDKAQVVKDLIEVGWAFVETGRAELQSAEPLNSVFYLMYEIMHDLYPSRKGGEAA